jgi:putative CocE/NonD family hydrolase
VYDPRFWPRDPYFEWFDHWLTGKSTTIVNEPAVFYSPRAWIENTSDYVPDDWRYSESWPPSETKTARWYLRGDGTLGNEPRGEERSYSYDPIHPVPTLGGRNLLITSGVHDQRPLQSLADYGLLYMSEPLLEDVTLAGCVTAMLTVASDCPDTDFVVKLIDVHPDEQALLIMDGITRAMYREGQPNPQPLTPRNAVPLRVSLGDIHHTFARGHRMEVDITSSNFPRHARNTNSGHSVLADDGSADIRIATNTVHHSECGTSYLDLLVLDTNETLGRSSPDSP